MTKASANSVEARTKPYLDRIENLLRDIDSRKGTYMAEIKEVRSDLREIYTEAKSNGIAVKALRGLVKYRELERKQVAIGDGLDIDEQSALSVLIEALGPLGIAAAERAGYKAPKDSSKDKPADGDLSKLGRGPIAAH